MTTPTEDELDEIKAILVDAMGDFPTEHLLEYHGDRIKALIDSKVNEAYKKGYIDRGIEQLKSQQTKEENK